jgi:RHS repeat-associated protein
VTTSYLWCGSDICQARNAGNAAIRGYYDEGEFVPGMPAQPYYYGIDQIGSVRRVFASTSSAPAYGYDPYGLALQATAPLTDFVYGGMFYNADSGLYLTQYRAYDPVSGRWLSRDSMDEGSDAAANLYAYAGGDPINRIDPKGLVGRIPNSPRTPTTTPDAGQGPFPSGLFGSKDRCNVFFHSDDKERLMSAKDLMHQFECPQT